MDHFRTNHNSHPSMFIYPIGEIVQRFSLKLLFLLRVSICYWEPFLALWLFGDFVCQLFPNKKNSLSSFLTSVANWKSVWWSRCNAVFFQSSGIKYFAQAFPGWKASLSEHLTSGRGKKKPNHWHFPYQLCEDQLRVFAVFNMAHGGDSVDLEEDVYR